MPRKLLLGLLLYAAPVAAQSTGTPVFHAPYRAFSRYEIGADVSDAGSIAIEGFYGWGRAGERWDLALRAGVLDHGSCCKTALLVGLDARLRVIDQNQDFPLDGAIISGVGAQLVGGGSRLFIPIGISLGRRVNFSHSTASIVPYAEPVLVPNFGSGRSDVAVALGLGGDLRFNRRFELRVSIGIGDIENFAVGFAVIR
ncbi:MAG TPA: hypothetical protein VGP61_09440 [Gemmatimonadales bacterium]|nr:hypothetical protein [Gemmatimonadales bacterium]